MNLPNVSDLLEGSNGFPHNRNLLRPILNLFNSDGGGFASIDHTLVILNRNPDPTLIEHTPEFFDKISHLEPYGWVQMRQVQLLSQTFAMKGFVEWEMEAGVMNIERRSRMLQLA